MKTIFSKYSRDRFPQYQIETSIIQEGSSCYVVKRALSEKANSHIEAIYRGYQWMSEDVLAAKIKQPRVIEKNHRQIVFEFIDGKSLERSLYAAFESVNRLQYLKEIDRYYDLLSNSFCIVDEFHLTPENESFFRNVDLGLIRNKQAYSPHSFLDLVMDNILMTAEGSYFYIDPEWVIPATFPWKFIFFRSLSNFYLQYGEFEVENFFPFAGLMNRYGISGSESDQYAKIEENFQWHIVRNHLYNRGQYLKKRVLLDELLTYNNETKQQLIRELEEHIKQLHNCNHSSSMELALAEAERKDLNEQIKIRDDQISRLHNSYSIRIGRAVLFPFKHIKNYFSNL